MKSICIFSASKLPIPAVKGGPKETVLQLLLDENEKSPRFDFTVLSAYDSRAAALGAGYRHTRFVYFKTHPRTDRFLEMISLLAHRCLNIRIPDSTVFVQELRYLKRRQDFDLVIHGILRERLSPYLAKAYPKERIAFMLHHKMPERRSDRARRIDGSFGYLIAVSDFVARDWMDLTGRERESVFVLPNCCDTRQMSQRLSADEKEAFRKSVGVREDDRVVVFVGRISNDKGTLSLVRALNLLSPTNVTLILCGECLSNARYGRCVDEEIGKATYPVIKAGYVRNAELYRYFNIADLAVMPSLCEEGACIANIEAMTAGVPLITTKRGAIPEYVCDGAAEFVAYNRDLVRTLAEKIDAVLNDEEKRRELSRNALMQTEKFTPERYFRNFSEIIDQIDRSER